MHESDRLGNNQKGGAIGTRGDTDIFHPEQAPQNLTPSSSRPPPSHPILKKPRGPSSSGPRPTARFVDVPDSDDENAQQSSSSQQSASGTSQSDGSTRNRNSARTPSRSRSPIKAERKPAVTKKFVASTTASKRRPALPRRQSSQSSTGSVGASSDNGAREGGSFGKKQLSQQTVTASPKQDSAIGGQDTPRLPTHVENSPPSSKALGKRPLNESNPGNPIIVKTSPQPDDREGTSAPKRLTSPLSQGQNAEESSPKLPPGSPKRPGPSAKALGKQPERSPESASTPSTRNTNPLGIYDSIAERTGYQAPTSPSTPADKADEGKAAGAQKASRDANPKGAPSMVRSKSNSESKRMSSGSSPASNFKSPSVVGMSKLAVTGGFDFETPRARPSDDDLPPLGADQPDLRKSSVLDSQLSPTQPSPTPAPPMGRSKSQLTLLLERDKVRVGDRHKGGGSSSSSGGGGAQKGDKSGQSTDEGKRKG